MPKRVYPVPEIILSPGIRIEDTADAHKGSMDNDSRIMRVPLMDTPNCRHVRAHEMAHAKYSPKKPLAPAGIHSMTLQRVEDMRMNVMCRNQGLHEAMDAPIITRPNIWDLLLTDNRSILTAGISTFATGDWGEYCHRISGISWTAEYPEFISEVHRQMEENPTWDQTIKLSLEVERFLNPDPEPEPGESGDDSEEGNEPEEGESSGDSSESGDSSDDSEESGESDDSDDAEYDGPMEEFDLSDSLMDRMVDSVLADEERDMSMSPFERGLSRLEEMKYDFGREGRNAVIVPAKVTVQKMPKRLPPSKFKSRQKVPADMGMVPKHMHRYCTDRAIFAGRGRKRSRGGTVVIDASRSMSIDAYQIDAILEEIPLGTIATYSGYHGYEGDLYVIAKNGSRAVDNLRPFGLMNLVDVPALEWMVKQDGPYYWVCDGIVSGANERKTSETFGANVFARCIELVEQNDIVMVPTLDALVKTIHEK
jgi:hypothetical protein